MAEGSDRAGLRTAAEMGEDSPHAAVVATTARKGRHRGETNICPATARSFLFVLLAALTEPRQAPTRVFAALGVHRPLEIADVGIDGDACCRGMHFLGPPGSCSALRR